MVKSPGIFDIFIFRKTNFLNEIVRKFVFFVKFFIKGNMKEAVSRVSKRDQFIEVAQNLFGIYGFEKVSMEEISAELKLSKASLYYYFSDKMSLYKAVVEKEQAEFISKITEITDNSWSPEKMLREYAILRLVYFRRFLNLGRLRQAAISVMRPGFSETMRKFGEKEIEIIVSVFEKGSRAGIFSIYDSYKTASLFLDLLKGLRSSVVKEKSMLVIEQEEYDALLEKTILFTEIFINGLKTSQV